MDVLGRGLDDLRGGGTEQGLLLLTGSAVVVHRLRVTALDDSHHLLTGDGLLLQQIGGDLVQQLPVLLQHPLGVLMALTDDGDDGTICGGVGLLSAAHGVRAVQILVLYAAQRHHVELLAHTEPGHQIPGHLRGPLDIVGGAGGHGVAHHLLAGPAGQQRADLRQNVLTGHEELLLLRQVQGIAQSALRMGDDGDLADGLGVFLLGRHQRMAHLMIGDDALFLVGDDGTLLLGAGNDGLEGRQQVILIHGAAAQPHGPQGCLVDKVCQICAHAAGGGLSDLLQIHVLSQMDAPGVDLQSGQTARQIGAIHGDAPVETAGTQQGLVQHLRAVGGAQNDDALAGIEAVQLRQQLVQGLLPLVVAAAETAAVTGFADGVDLVDEDDAGSHLGGLLEQVTDTGGAHAHEHLHKVRAGDGEEGDVGLAGYRLGKQSLAGTGRAHQQSALGQSCTDGRVLLGIVEEVDDLLQRLLGLVLTGHVLEGDTGGLLHIHLGVGLAHAADASDTAAVFCHDPHHQHEQGHHDDHRKDIGDHELQNGTHLRLNGAGVLDVVFLQQRQETGVIESGGIQDQRRFLALGIALGFLVLIGGLLGVDVAVHGGGIQDALLDLQLRHLILLNEVDKLAVRDLMAAGPLGEIVAVSVDIVEHHRQHQRPDDEGHHPPHIAVAVLVIFLVFLVVGIHVGLLPCSPAGRGAEVL